MGIISDIFLPLALAFIMLSLGLSLTSQDFIKIFKEPKIFFVGFFSQIIVLPLVALILVIVWPLSPELSVGVMLIAAAPGGATSNIITSLAKGDVALSVSLTAVISLFCVITVPIIIFISLYIFTNDEASNSISILNVAIQMFLIVTVPVILGMIVRKFLPPFSISFEPFAKKISILLFTTVLIGAILSQKENILTYFAQAGLVTLVLNLLMMFIAFYISVFFKMSSAQKKTITIECGLQNGTVAIVVATTVFPNESIYLIPAATYSLLMFLTSLIYVYIFRKN